MQILYHEMFILWSWMMVYVIHPLHTYETHLSGKETGLLNCLMCIDFM
jgi:hypothetical protein